MYLLKREDEKGVLSKLSEWIPESPLHSSAVRWGPEGKRVYLLSESGVTVLERTSADELRWLTTINVESISADFIAPNAIALASDGNDVLLTSKGDSGVPAALAVLNVARLGQPVSIPTPPLTPTPLIPPTHTPSPTPLATPTAVPIELTEEQVTYSTLAGFNDPASAEFGSVPSNHAFPGTTDGWGMVFSMEPGQGVFIPINVPIDLGDGWAEISIAVRSSSSSIRLALVAVALPVDGSIGFINPSGSEIPVDRWGSIRLVYESPTGSFLPALQIVVPENEDLSAIDIYLDSLRVSSFEHRNIQIQKYSVDVSFDTIPPDFSELNTNAFLAPDAVTGKIEKVIGSRNNGLRFSLTPKQSALHIAPFSTANAYPMMLNCSVDVKRESGDDSGGMLGIVVTDGEQNLGCFLRTSHLSMDRYQTIGIGSNFESNVKPIPPVTVIQLGGSGVNGNIVIDDLQLFISD